MAAAPVLERESGAAVVEELSRRLGYRGTIPDPEATLDPPPWHLERAGPERR